MSRLRHRSIVPQSAVESRADPTSASSHRAGRIGRRRVAQLPAAWLSAGRPPLKNRPLAVIRGVGGVEPSPSGYTSASNSAPWRTDARPAFSRGMVDMNYLRPAPGATQQPRHRHALDDSRTMQPRFARSESRQTGRARRNGKAQSSRQIKHGDDRGVERAGRRLRSVASSSRPSLADRHRLPARWRAGETKAVVEHPAWAWRMTEESERAGTAARLGRQQPLVSQRQGCRYRPSAEQESTGISWLSALDRRRRTTEGVTVRRRTDDRRAGALDRLGRCADRSDEG